MISFYCSSCRKSLEIEDAGAGMTLACPACAAEIVVPGRAVQDTPESVLQFVCEQAGRKAALKMYYAAADLAREYMGPLADATKVEREKLALAYEQQGREAEAQRARRDAPAVIADPVGTAPTPEIPTRVEPPATRVVALHVPKAVDRPVRVLPNKAESTGVTARPLETSPHDDEKSTDVPPIIVTGWRLLCAYAIVSLIALFALDAELRAKFDQLQQISTMTPQNIFALRLELQNPFSTRSTLLELLDWTERGLLVVIAICAIIALAKDQVKHGLVLLAAAAVSFALVYFAATRVAHNRTQPLIDQANQQMQQFQQTMDAMTQQMLRQMQQMSPPHR